MWKPRGQKSSALRLSEVAARRKAAKIKLLSTAGCAAVSNHGRGDLGCLFDPMHMAHMLKIVRHGEGVEDGLRT